MPFLVARAVLWGESAAKMVQRVTFRRRCVPLRAFLRGHCRVQIAHHFPEARVCGRLWLPRRRARAALARSAARVARDGACCHLLSSRARVPAGTRTATGRT
jgi:hypothetical protein